VALDLDLILSTLRGWYWPFLRLSALLLVAPVFSAGTVSVRVRIALAVVVAALLAPLAAPASPPDAISGIGLLLAVREVAIGLCIGFIMQMVFAAVIVAGETVAMSMGLGFAMTVDPQNGVQVPVVSQLNVILATLLFLAIDGHLVLLMALGESFRLLPVAQPGLAFDSFGNVAAFGAQIFATALLLALPALTAVLMINIAFGVITRAAPQLNIFAVGFPVTILAGFFFMLLALPGFLDTLRRFIEAGLQRTLLVFG